MTHNAERQEETMNGRAPFKHWGRGNSAENNQRQRRQRHTGESHEVVERARREEGRTELQNNTKNSGHDSLKRFAKIIKNKTATKTFRTRRPANGGNGDPSCDPQQEVHAGGSQTALPLSQPGPPRRLYTKFTFD